MKVLDHDFPLPELGKAAPYGVYDIPANEGFVNVGISADTAQFAVASIRNWWYSMGIKRYPSAKRLLITADGGKKQRKPQQTLEKLNYRLLQMKLDLKSVSVIFHQEHQNGIKLNTECSVRLQRTGEDAH